MREKAEREEEARAPGIGRRHVACCCVFSSPLGPSFI
jgi:hypothetical protein